MTSAREYLEKAFIALCSTSLCVNAWFVAHIFESMEKMNDKLGSIGEELSATKAEVQMHTSSISYLQREQDRARAHNHKDN